MKYKLDSYCGHGKRIEDSHVRERYPSLVFLPLRTTIFTIEYCLDNDVVTFQAGGELELAYYLSDVRSLTWARMIKKLTRDGRVTEATVEHNGAEVNRRRRVGSDVLG